MTESIDAFQNGLFTTIQPILLELDSKIQFTRHSQIELGKELEKIQLELTKYVSLASAPNNHNQEMELRLKQVDSLRKRIIVVNTTLNSLKDRLDKCLNTLAASQRSTFIS